MKLFNELVLWTQSTFAPLGLWGLFILSVIESVFFPVPPDILIVLLTLQNPDAFLMIALVATLGSLIGGLIGYCIGYLGEKTILEKMVSKKKISKLHRLFDRYGAGSVLIAAFTPLPYKIFTIGAGVFYINIKKFILASLIGRGGRFLLVAWSVYAYGDSIVSTLDKYVFNPFALTAVAGFIALFFYLKYRRRLTF
ncbi:DedA family protein [Candidatus Woesearchaeota archaeon]|nr:DedA family protein [Candidatus Woesearchaeota archaeon]